MRCSAYRTAGCKGGLYSRVATDYAGQSDRGCTCVSQQVTMNTVGNDRRVLDARRIS